MRVNVYAEEMTDEVKVVCKNINGNNFTGIRFPLHLPVTNLDGSQHKGPFIRGPGDDDSSAVTFWGKKDLRKVLYTALEALDRHYLGGEEEKAVCETPDEYPEVSNTPRTEVPGDPGHLTH